MNVGLSCLFMLLTSGTFIRHLSPQERTIDRYIQYFVGLVNGSDESVELFLEQRRASPEMKRLLTRRQREMQDRRRALRNSVDPSGSHYSYGSGDQQWNLVSERGDLEELREVVGDRLLKCLSRDITFPKDVRETISRFTATDPAARRRGDLEELQMDDPRAAQRRTTKSCLRNFEGDLIAFLKGLADPDGERYLVRFNRLLRRDKSERGYRKLLGGNGDVGRLGAEDEDDDYDDDDNDGKLAWWKVLLIVLLVIAILAAIGYGLYWFFREMRLENRFKLGAAAAGIPTSAAANPTSE